MKGPATILRFPFSKERWLRLLARRCEKVQRKSQLMLPDRRTQLDAAIIERAAHIPLEPSK